MWFLAAGSRPNLGQVRGPAGDKASACGPDGVWPTGTGVVGRFECTSLWNVRLVHFVPRLGAAVQGVLGEEHCKERSLARIGLILGPVRVRVNAPVVSPPDEAGADVGPDGRRFGTGRHVRSPDVTIPDARRRPKRGRYRRFEVHGRACRAHRGVGRWATLCHGFHAIPGGRDE